MESQIFVQGWPCVAVEGGYVYLWCYPNLALNVSEMPVKPFWNYFWGIDLSKNLRMTTIRHSRTEKYTTCDFGNALHPPRTENYVKISYLSLIYLMCLLLFKSVSKNGQLMHLCVPIKGYCIKLEESSYKHLKGSIQGTFILILSEKIVILYQRYKSAFPTHPTIEIKNSHWRLSHMDQNRPLIYLAYTCTLTPR